MTLPDHRTVREAASRPLAVLTAALLAFGGVVAGATAAHAAETTYTHGDGATVTYDTEARIGEPITLTGTGWMAKEGHPEVAEGNEGSVIGFKLIDSATGQLNRIDPPGDELYNPMTGTLVDNMTVWGVAMANGIGWGDEYPAGEWSVTLPWPTVDTATQDPGWEVGDTFTIQLLSGTMYSDEVCADGCDRSDVSRTIPLTITVVGDEEPAGPLVITQQPTDVSAAAGQQAVFAAAVSGGVEPVTVTVTWQRGNNFTATPPSWIDVAGATDATLSVTAGTSPHLNNRWYRAVFTDAEGATVTTAAAKLSVIPLPSVVENPLGQTVSVGGTATFTAEGSSAVEMTASWQSTTALLPNGDPDPATWTPVPGANSATLEVEGTDAAAQHGTFYRAVFTNVSGSVYSQPVQLRFFELLDTNTSVAVSGESYGPVQPNTAFSVSAPNAVVAGEPIIIEGFGYLAVDGERGAIANALVDAEYSGDPRTLSTTRIVYNPQAETVYSDKRGHNVVQAGGTGGNVGAQTLVGAGGEAVLQSYSEWEPGYFQLVIPWPDHTNTTQTEAFFAEHWAPGTQHSVRLLTGSILTPSGADYQRGISVRFTVVEEATPPPAVAPQVSAQPEHVTVEVGSDATFAAAATGDPTPTVQWESSTDGGTTWADVVGATQPELSLEAVPADQTGTWFRAVFTNAGGSEATSPAVLTVTPVQDDAFTYTVASGGGLPAGTLITPKEVEVGESITISGTGWFLQNGSGGSAGPIFINRPLGGTGAVDVDGRVIENQFPDSTYVDARAHGVFLSDDDGNWSITIPFPTPENSTLTEETAWQPGQVQSLRILTGSLATGDYSRSVGVDFTLVAPEPVDVAPVVTGQPVDASVEVGETATFTAVASGTPVPTVQWESSTDGVVWSAVAGATGGTLTVADATLAQSGTLFRAAFVNVAGVATSAVAELTVTALPEPPVEPDFTPEPPVESAEDLPAELEDAVTIEQNGETAEVTIPGAEEGEWFFVYGYSTAVPLGWHAADANGSFLVDLAPLGSGEHTLVVLNTDAEMRAGAPCSSVARTATTTPVRTTRRRVTTIAALCPPPVARFRVH